MKRSIFPVAGAILFLLSSQSFAATVIYDEAIDGDLSPTPSSPTVIGDVITESFTLLGSEQFHDARYRIGDELKFTVANGVSLWGAAQGGVTVGFPILRATMSFSLGRAPYDSVYELIYSSDESSPSWYERVLLPSSGGMGGHYENVLIDAPVLTAGDWYLGTSGYGIQYDWAAPCEEVWPVKICGLAETNYQISFTNTPPTTTVPVPAAVWMFGAGLLGLAGMGRRKARTL